MKSLLILLIVIGFIIIILIKLGPYVSKKIEQVDKWLYKNYCKACTLDEIDKCFLDHDFVEHYNKTKFNFIVVLSFFFAAVKFGTESFVQILDIESKKANNHIEITYYISIIFLILIGIFVFSLINSNLKQQCLLCKKYSKKIKEQKEDK